MDNFDLERGTAQSKQRLRQEKQVQRRDDGPQRGEANVEAAEQLFSAAKSQFKRLDHFYFHNCLYESVWKNNRRRHAERTPTQDVINTYGRDYRVIFVGDASMSPHEIAMPGGSVEHVNPEPGQVWLQSISLGQGLLEPDNFAYYPPRTVGFRFGVTY